MLVEILPKPLKRATISFLLRLRPLSPGSTPLSESSRRRESGFEEEEDTPTSAKRILKAVPRPVIYKTRDKETCI